MDIKHGDSEIQTIIRKNEAIKILCHVPKTSASEPASSSASGRSEATTKSSK